MKTLKKAFLATTVTGTFLFFALGSMNSIVVDKNAFLKNDLNIKFAKRLDDIQGVVTVGRTAASLPKFDMSKSLTTKTVEPKQFKKMVKAVAPKKVEEKVEEVVEVTNPPAVQNTGSLELTGGLYQKRSLEGAKFSGSVQVRNGIIEGLSANLPDGRSLSISVIRTEMVGNVFQYEDSETRELKSGLFYPVNVAKGEYMLNLTDDTNFAGLRLEFKNPELQAEGVVTSNWEMNDQNEEEQADEYAQDIDSEREIEMEEPNTEEGYDQEQELENDYAQNEEQQETYAFAF
jgi:hypothetical protein